MIKSLRMLLWVSLAMLSCSVNLFATAMEELEDTADNTSYFDGGDGSTINTSVYDEDVSEDYYEESE